VSLAVSRIFKCGGAFQAPRQNHKKKGLAVKNRCHDFITIQFPIQNEW
jgi:hypothetical protein